MTLSRMEQRPLVTSVPMSVNLALAPVWSNMMTGLFKFKYYVLGLHELFDCVDETPDYVKYSKS